MRKFMMLWNSNWKYGYADCCGSGSSWIMSGDKQFRTLFPGSRAEIRKLDGISKVLKINGGEGASPHLESVDGLIL